MAKKRPQCQTEGCDNLAKKRLVAGKFHPLCSSCLRKKYNMKRKYYHKFKKDYCENVDGRLGFRCTTTIEDPCMLSVDHMDGDRNNNAPQNLATLCACCHNYKTKLFRDFLTPKQKKRRR